MKPLSLYERAERTWRRGIVVAREAAKPAELRRRIPVIAVGLAASIGCGCAIYLSIRGTGQVSTVPWMPETIGQWADNHGRLRNFPAYFLLACPFLLLLRAALARLWAIGFVGILGTVLELAEYFVPGRTVEWQDVAWSWAGALAAWALFESVYWVIIRLRTPAACQQPS